MSCQAKIGKVGEIVVVTKKKTEDEKAKDPDEEYRREFADLPLEKKIANLLQLEMMTLSETLSFILNSPYKIVGKVMDVMAEFGMKVEDETKNATRPDEHKTEENGNSPDKSDKKANNKSSARKKTADEKSEGED